MQSTNVAIIDVEAEATPADDESWARANLRFENGKPLLDIANCLRVIERHPEFRGRYKFNEVLGKVLDKGTVMIEWRLIDFAVTLQERFLPGVALEISSKALVVAANRAGSK